MIRKIGLAIVLIIFLSTSVFSQPPPTTLDSVIKYGHTLNNKISSYLEVEYKAGRFSRFTSIEKQNTYIKYIANEIINKYDKLKIIESNVSTWGQPGDLDYIMVKIKVECTECPDNICNLEYTYKIVKFVQEPVQPDKSIKI